MERNMRHFTFRSLRNVWLALIFVFFALNNDSLYAKETGTLGAGIVLGDPIGPNVKYWLNPKAALDVGLGFKKDFTVYTDFLWHEWTLFPQPPRGSLAGYFGLGLRYEEKRGNDDFGFRMVTGAAYWFPSHPIEVFLEIVPVFQVSPDTDTDVDAGIGLRYYFHGFNRPSPSSVTYGR